LVAERLMHGVDPKDKAKHVEKSHL